MLRVMHYDLIVIGSGPGGYVCAIRAAQLGMKVAVVEKDKTFGGTCLNVGCIPSKALLHASELFEESGHLFDKMGIKLGQPKLDLAAMMKFKDEGVDGNVKGVAFLFKKNKIDTFAGVGRIAGPGKVEVKAADGSSQVIEGKAVVIATGSDVARLRGVEIDEQRIVSSTGALVLDKVPQRLLVVGAGVIGLELGSVWRRLGSEVVVVEFLDRILPGLDSEADVVLVSIGRVPFTEGLGLEEAGVKTDNKGRVIVDARYTTNVPGIYAIGDAIAGPMLAHKAQDEGVAVAENLAGRSGHVNYEVIPNVVYTYPEVASVGKSEDELKQGGIAYKVGKFPFTANGRAKVNLQTEGFVKILADAKTDRVLGVHIVGADAGNMIAEAAVAMEFGAASEDIARTCHAHPTLTEAVKEAALAVDNRAIHM
jgi:dihydrolipoyl dehydrogenase